MEMFREETVQNSKMSSDIETDGFDLSAGKTWIYPENCPVREYQLNIVQAALYNNTLVCLPTGLGKTFIASVVMYNFWRWYPQGKVVFLAPTKPLVAQQIHACHNIMSIPSVETIELTGAVSKKNREIAWNKKRVFFATPQVFENDLQKEVFPAKMVKCVVIDEAHKALGKHSYCECIRLLHMQNQYFRILALSATPGNKIASVQEVLQNLHISHLELRDETSLDVVPYINQRKVEIILVPLSDHLGKYKDRYIVIMDRHVKVLIQNNVLHSQTANISKGRIFHISKEFQKMTNKSGNYGIIVKTLNILLTMYHAFELMIRHGLRAFLKFYETHSDKFWMNDEHNLQVLLKDIKDYLGPFPDSQSLLHGTIPEISNSLIFGHNKFYKLKELLLRHFEQAAKTQVSTRAIVFVEYKDIVYEVYVLLLQTRPLIRPQMFVGISGQKQKQQKQALEDFRNDTVNVLISTSIGEEGLDVGEVDLIICFDASQQSPIRLVQRMGRTGRNRDGHIIVLVTDGKEHETLKSAMARRDSLNNRILNTINVATSLYEHNPRMIPKEFKPECYKMHINIQPKTPVVKAKGRKRPIDKKKIKDDIGVKVDDNKLKLQKSDLKCITQTSMTKFLKDSKCNDQLIDTDIATNVSTWCDVVSTKVKESNIKLLSSDNDTIEFLTLCAMKESEKEMSTDVCSKIDTSYIYVPLPADNFFNFVIPNIQILDNISSLNDKIALSLPTNDANNEVDAGNISDCDFGCTCLHQVSSPLDQINKSIEFGESKFEDILDESSDSEKIETVCSVNKSDNPGDNEDQLPLTTTLCSDKKQDTFENLLDESSESSDGEVWIDSAKKKADTTEYKSVKNDRYDVFTIHQRGGITDKSFVNAKTDIEKTVSSASIEQNLRRQAKETFSIEKPLNNTLGGIRLNRLKDNKKTDDIKSNVTHSEWDSDFETSSATITNVEYFKKQNTPVRTETQRRNSEIRSSLKNPDPENARNSDWISLDSNWRTQLENCTPPQRLSKKILSLKKAPNSNRSPVRTRLGETFDSDSDFSFTSDDVKEFNQLESDYFNEKSVRNLTGCMSASGNYNGVKKSELPVIKDSPCSSTCASSNERCSAQRSVSKLNTNSGNAFAVRSKQTMRIENRMNKQKFQRQKNEFLDDEAAVSCHDISSDESSGTDEDLGNFVSYTQDVQDAVDMQAHYLQAIKSPVARPGNFVFKPPTSSIADIDIYSQPLSDEDETYLHDSFCVDTTVEETNLSKQAFGYSLLEEAEKVLENRKRKRNRQRGSSDNTSKKLKKINALNKSTSSEDEIEILREQIRDK